MIIIKRAVEIMKVTVNEIGKDSMFKIWHSQNAYMFMLTFSEGGSIVSDENVHPIKRGTLVLIAPNKYHYTMPLVPEVYDRSKLFLTKEEAVKLFTSLGFGGALDSSLIYAAVPEEELAVAERAFKALFSECDSPKYGEARLAASVAELLILLDKYSANKENAVSDIVTRAVKYVNDHIAEDIGINEIAAFVSTSKYHFCRCFKAAMGITVMEYILKTRIMLAKEMLYGTELSVSEISDLCGFSGVSYFCRAFRDDVGESPLRFRRSSRLRQ